MIVKSFLFIQLVSALLPDGSERCFSIESFIRDDSIFCSLCMEHCKAGGREGDLRRYCSGLISFLRRARMTDAASQESTQRDAELAQRVAAVLSQVSFHYNKLFATEY